MRDRRIWFAALGATLAMTGAACSSSGSASEGGGAGDPNHGPRAAAAFGSVSPFTPPGASAIDADGSEWRIVTTSARAVAGPVDFTFTNDGTQVHEMIVVRTDAPLGALHVDPTTQRIDEEDPSIEIVDEIPEVEVGDTGAATIDLEAGRYQIICNLPGHYANGMRTQLTVE